MRYGPFSSGKGVGALTALMLAWAVLIILLVEFARAVAFILG